MKEDNNWFADNVWWCNWIIDTLVYSLQMWYSENISSWVAYKSDANQNKTLSRAENNLCIKVQFRT